MKGKLPGVAWIVTRQNARLRYERTFFAPSRWDDLLYHARYY